MFPPLELAKSPLNPLLTLYPGNTANSTVRQSPQYGDGRQKSLALTNAGAIRYQPGRNARYNFTPNPKGMAGGTSWPANGAGATVTHGIAVTNHPIGIATAVRIAGTTGAGDTNSDGSAFFAEFLDPTIPHTFSFWAFLESGGGDWSIVPSLRNANDTFIYNVAASDITVVSGWTRFSMTLTPSASGASVGAVRIKIVRKSASAGQILVTGAMASPGSTLESYFDGSWYPSSAWLVPKTGYIGSANLSPSVSSATSWIVEGEINTVLDPSFEAASINTNWVVRNLATISKITTNFWLGANAAKVICTASISDGISQRTTTGSAASSGQPWTAQALIRAFAAADIGKTVKLVIIERDASDAVVLTNSSPAFTLTDVWQPISYIVNLSGGVTTAKATVQVMNAAASVVTFLTNCVQLAQKGYVTPYTDGSLGAGQSWASTAHASVSTRVAATSKMDETSKLNSGKGSVYLLYYRDVDTGAAQTLLDVGDGTSGKDRVTLRVNSSDKFEMGWTSDGAAETTIASTGALATGTWYSLYAEWNGTYVSLSVDNGPRVSGLRNQPKFSIVTANDLAIGSLNTGSSQANGRIGGVGIFDSQLTIQELSRLSVLDTLSRFDTILRNGVI